MILSLNIFGTSANLIHCRHKSYSETMSIRTFEAAVPDSHYSEPASAIHAHAFNFHSANLLATKELNSPVELLISSGRHFRISFEGESCGRVGRRSSDPPFL